MDGRQYFSAYGGNFQQVPDFSGVGYGRGYGMPGNYFMPGPNAGAVSAIFLVVSNVERVKVACVT